MQNILKNQTVSSDSLSDETCFYSLNDSFQNLCAIQQTALSLSPKPDFSAALKAEELKGKLFGLYHDKKEKEKITEALPKVLVEFIEQSQQSDLKQNQMSDEIDYIE